MPVEGSSREVVGAAGLQLFCVLFVFWLICPQLGPI